MRLLLVTDAWAPQVNGVVVTLRNTIACLGRLGYDVHVLSPEGMRTVPMPTYPEIPLAVLPGREVARRFRELQPEAVHIATEGPVGIAARDYCVANGLAFTTAYHTCFPEYVQPRFGIPLAWTYAWLRRFHRPSSAVLVGTDTIRTMLEQRGFSRVADWSRGVDLELFHPRPARYTEYPGPVFVFVGRVAVEKNLPAFLALDLPGTKLVVGDGPERARLQRRYPDAVFVGMKTGAELAACYQRADVFVFPSRTDTFGLVLLEAMACGTPVAAFPVRGPIDVIKEPRAGILNEDLREAAMTALLLDRAEVRGYAEQYSWERAPCSLPRISLPRRTVPRPSFQRPPRTASDRSGRPVQEVAGEPRVEPIERKEHRQIGTVEVAIPGRLPADPGTQAQVALHQRRHGNGRAGSVLVQRQRAARVDAELLRRQSVRGDAPEDRGRTLPAVTEADARAPDQVIVAIVDGVLRQRRPHEEHHHARAMGGIDAGASHFRHAAAQRAEPAEIELALRVVAADRARALPGREFGRCRRPRPRRRRARPDGRNGGRIRPRRRRGRGTPVARPAPRRTRGSAGAALPR